LAQDLRVGITTDQGRGRQRQRGYVRSLAGGDVDLGASAPHEGVARRTRQVECRRERAHRIGMGPAPFPALQGADGVDR